jgi:polar amino acid transport system substrate-binding protein
MNNMVESMTPNIRSSPIISRFRLIVVTTFLLLSSFTVADNKTIAIGADPWCPYICDIDSKHQGIMVDIAREALALSGYTLNYQVINWARAKLLVTSGKLDGIIGMSHSKETEPLYYFSNAPLGQTQTCFYRRKNDDWEYQSPDSLENKIFGWINNYRYLHEPLDLWINNHKHSAQIVTLSGVKVHSRLVKLMSLNRIDIFAEDKNVIAFELKKLGLEKEIVIAGCLESVDEDHLAFSLKSKYKEEWAKALEYGVDKLHQSGKIDEILSFYGLTKEVWLYADDVITQTVEH